MSEGKATAVDFGACPICTRGRLLESRFGMYCSRRYDERNDCGFEAGMCDSPDEWDRVVEQAREAEPERRWRRVIDDLPAWAIARAHRVPVPGPSPAGPRAT